MDVKHINESVSVDSSQDSLSFTGLDRRIGELIKIQHERRFLIVLDDL